MRRRNECLGDLSAGLLWHVRSGERHLLPWQGAQQWRVVARDRQTQHTSIDSWITLHCRQCRGCPTFRVLRNGDDIMHDGRTAEHWIMSFPRQRRNEENLNHIIWPSRPLQVLSASTLSASVQSHPQHWHQSYRLPANIVLSGERRGQGGGSREYQAVAATTSILPTTFLPGYTRSPSCLFKSSGAS